MRIFLLCSLLLAGLGDRPAAATFLIGTADRADSVFFRSTASLEFIEGKTGDLEGWLEWLPEQPQAPATGVLRVDLRTLRTGIETRDEHMRDRHLETDKFPFAWFELSGLSGLPNAMADDSIYHAVVQGFFYIHGGRRPLQAQAEIRYRGADSTLSAMVQFTLKLDDYGINRPKALFLKLAETIEVEVVLTAGPGPGQADLPLPEWPELK